MFTAGKLHFWVMPNLDNEKCGFFESFHPLYSVEWKKEKSKKKKKQTGDDKDTQEVSDDNKNGETEIELENMKEASEDS